MELGNPESVVIDKNQAVLARNCKGPIGETSAVLEGFRHRCPDGSLCPEDSVDLSTARTFQIVTRWIIEVLPVQLEPLLE